VDAGIRRGYILIGASSTADFTKKKQPDVNDILMCLFII